MNYYNNSKKHYSHYQEFPLEHITHIDNLVNILKYGLLSHTIAFKNGLTQVDISEQDINLNRKFIKDKIYYKSLHEYAPLFFNALNPMLYKRKELIDKLCVLRFNRSLISQIGVIFTDGNAAHSNTKFYQHENDLIKLDWYCIYETIYWNSIEDGKRIRMAEVLVPDSVDIKYLYEIVVFSDATKLEVENLISNSININVILTEFKI
jgi:hypothetical protein